MSDGDLFLIILTAGVLLSAAFLGGRNQGREEMIHRVLGMKRTNNRWEVREGTEIMGMKWVTRYWVYDDGKKTRRINYNDGSRYWEFEDGTRPERVEPGLKEIQGHWETSDGKQIDPTQMKPHEFADTLHEWASKVGKFLPLGVEGVKIAFQLVERDSVIKKYGAVLEKPASMFRQESELPFPKAVIRRRLAEALLRDDLDEDMRNHLSTGLTTLEYFLPKDEFDIINPFFELFQDKEVLDLVERRKREEDISEHDMKTLAEKITRVGFKSAWDRVCNRERERCYHVRILKSIALGEIDPDMAQLLTQANKELDEAASRLRDRRRAVP